MKRIGFIDYDLNNYHANVYEEAIHGPLKNRGFQIGACTAIKKEESSKWAGQKKVPYVDRIQDLKGMVDYLMILAPSNPETHLELVQQALLLELPLYVDKTFAPNLSTAKQIFNLTDKAKVPLISTSALRYADEVANTLKELSPHPVLQVQIYSGGKNYTEYCIHPIETAIRLMGWEVQRVRRLESGSLSQIELSYKDGRIATIFVYPNTDVKFSVTMTTATQSRRVEVTSPIFVNTMSAIMDFFSSKRETIDRRETLMIREIMDLCEKPSIKEGIKTSL
jgi:hypothetical protein